MDLNLKYFAIHAVYQYNLIMKIVSQNKKVGFLYQLYDKFEAGLVLSGIEVKSARNKKVNISTAYIKLLYHQNINPEIFLIGSDFGNKENIRSIKLLLNRQEINKLIGKVQEKNFTLVPLKLYFKRNILKLEFAVAKGLKKFDKRKKIREKEENKRIRNI